MVTMTLETIEDKVKKTKKKLRISRVVSEEPTFINIIIIWFTADIPLYHTCNFIYGY